MKLKVILPRTLEDLEECKRLDAEGKLVSGSSYPTREQLDAMPSDYARALKANPYRDQVGKLIRTCAIYSYDTGKQELVGRVFLIDNGSISFEVAPGHDPGNIRAMSMVTNSPVRLRPSGRLVMKEDDPKTWFENLPRMYHGSYMWAEMI